MHEYIRYCFRTLTENIEEKDRSPEFPDFSGNHETIPIINKNTSFEETTSSDHPNLKIINLPITNFEDTQKVAVRNFVESILLRKLKIKKISYCIHIIDKLYDCFIKFRLELAEEQEE